MRSARGRAATAILIIGLATWTSSSIADVDVSGDSRLDVAKLRALIALELGADADAVHVVVEVTGARAVVKIVSPENATHSGTVDLQTTRDSERAIALFVGELARQTAPAATASTATAASSLSSDAGVPKAPLVGDAIAPIDALVADAAAPAAASSTGGDAATPTVPGDSAAAPYGQAGGALRVMFSGGALLVGGTVEAGARLGGRARLGLIGRYAFASADDVLGTVRAQLAGGGALFAYRLAGRGDGVNLDAGARLEVAWLGGAGEGVGGRSTSGIGFAPALFIEPRVTLFAPVSLALALDAGWLSPGLELFAANRRALSIAGAFAGTTLSVRLGR